MKFTRTPIGLIKDENAIDVGEKLYLRFVNDQQSHYKGEVGMATGFKDSFGKDLYVGDFVEVRHPNGYVSQNYVVVETNTNDGEKLYTHYFCVHGYAHREPIAVSLVPSGYLVTLIKSHKELKHGDNFSMIHALMLDESICPDFDWQRPIPDRHPIKNTYLTRIGNNSAHYGKIGKKTHYSDCFGRKLAVGDVVNVFDKENNLIFTGFLGKVKIPSKNLSIDRFKYAILGLNESDERVDVFDCRTQRLELKKPLEELSPYSTYNNFRVSVHHIEPEIAEVEQINAFYEEMRAFLGI